MKPKQSWKRYFEFSKVEKQEDGTLKVIGIASSEAVDSEGEIIKADAMRAAIPDYMTFGAVREMHQPIAAGTALNIHVDDAGITHLEALVVDPASVKKVETGVLKGYSIGGRVLDRDKVNKKIITELQLNEISLVDRPANPDCKMQIAKFDDEGRRIDLEDAPEPAVEKVSTGKLKKGMYEVRCFADVITSLHYLVRDTQAETVWEGDKSPIPAKLHAACKNLISIFREMVDEETTEMLGMTADLEGPEILSMATKAIESSDLAKAGRKFSKYVAGEMAHMHKNAQEICDKFQALGYVANEEVPEEGAENEEEEAAKINKGLTVEKDELQKALDAEKAEKATLQEQLTKAQTEKATAETALTTVTGERDKLTSEIADIAKSMTEKGILKAVSKEDDGQPVKPTEPVGKKDAVGEPISEIRKALQTPIEIKGR